MPEDSFDNILEQINTRDSEEAWGLFLDQYAATILQVVKHFERDSDFVPDCFQFVCEQLSANSFYRLTRFQPQGPAVFSTWLRAVVRNLCLDWRRKRFGRRRLFNSRGFRFLIRKSFAACMNGDSPLTTPFIRCE